MDVFVHGRRDGGPSRLVTRNAVLELPGDPPPRGTEDDPIVISLMRGCYVTLEYFDDRQVALRQLGG